MLPDAVRSHESRRAALHELPYTTPVRWADVSVYLCSHCQDATDKFGTCALLLAARDGRSNAVTELAESGAIRSLLDHFAGSAWRLHNGGKARLPS